MQNPFDKYKKSDYTVEIESLGKIKLREFTVEESTAYSKRMVLINEEGDAKLNYNDIAEIKLDKVSAALVEPKMTVEQLKALNSNAIEVIEAINKAIDEHEGKKKS